jgi:hypothetical protein
MPRSVRSCPRETGAGRARRLRSPGGDGASRGRLHPVRVPAPGYSSRTVAADPPARNRTFVTCGWSIQLPGVLSRTSGEAGARPLLDGCYRLIACTGVMRSVAVPSPSWPKVFKPQAQTVPSVCAHVGPV